MSVGKLSIARRVLFEISRERLERSALRLAEAAGRLELSRLRRLTRKGASRAEN